MAEKPISESDGIFARAYAKALEGLLAINLNPDNDILLTSPVTMRGPAAGAGIYPQMTNYLIYQLGDSLQSSTNPSYTGATVGSYIGQLETYLSWVLLKRDISVEAQLQLAEARGNFSTAAANYRVVEDAAWDRWDKVKGRFPKNFTFARWIAANEYPEYTAARNTVNVNSAALKQALGQVFGRDAQALNRYIDGVGSALQKTASVPSYNQEALSADKDRIAALTKQGATGVLPPEEDVSKDFTFVPSYSVGGTYGTEVTQWKKNAADHKPRDVSITISVQDGLDTKWEDYGYKQVEGGSGGGFWPFFYAYVYHEGKEERRELNTQHREKSIHASLAMIGAGIFPLRADLWDAPNPKVLFPIVADGAPPDVLGPKFAKISSVMIGYDVELKIDFDEDLRNEVHQIYEEVKTTKGRMSIFGFWVSAGAGGSSSERVETKFDDVKWSKESGSMRLPAASGQGAPILLGAIAQKFK
ncbi:hypothetical protein D9757_007346 [Collybiopsis confluens]|uniref:Uncharacterized protein n=1 Tax=Collybiopsis confluens TaxID=2823264 RepID=A0A8H5HIC3_9AGAR|nr:hypothetical protein D9757_007346 [Collybiopsis confluens]